MFSFQILFGGRFWFLFFVIASRASLLKHVWKYPSAVNSLINFFFQLEKLFWQKNFPVHLARANVKGKLLLFINWKSVEVFIRTRSCKRNNKIKLLQGKKGRENTLIWMASAGSSLRKRFGFPPEKCFQKTFYFAAR